jgi:16S rRNA (cytosine1402-N4)-methyltransferase
MSVYHTPCMPEEVAHYLACRPGGVYVDGTLGGAGHARMICSLIGPTGRLIGIDQDHDAIRQAQQVLAPFASQVHLIHDNFSRLPRILETLAIPAVDGILLDLGVSWHQLEASGRGFSFRRAEPLDMRMNTDAGETAADYIAAADEKTLARVFYEYGEERYARAIARAIVRARSRQPISDSLALAEVVRRAMPAPAARRQRIHPATRVFMALRIAVNHELEHLADTLPAAMAFLKPGGRLCVLAFHSLEDRIVKQAFREMSRACRCAPEAPACTCEGRPQVRLLTRKVVRPTAAEVEVNPMARSTRLRAVEKC